MRPKLLDLFCGAGGAAMGYYRAGFDVVGIDIEPQPFYPFEFIQADALEPPVRLDDFAMTHASPPCQAYVAMSNRWRGAGGLADQRPDLVGAVRDMLETSGRPYVIENVRGAPLRNALTLTGEMFGLRVHRPRLFECSPFILAPPPSPGSATPSRYTARRRTAGCSGVGRTAPNTAPPARSSLPPRRWGWTGVIGTGSERRSRPHTRNGSASRCYRSSPPKTKHGPHAPRTY